MAPPKRRILFLTVIPSPYQRQLFDRLSRVPDFDIRVLYYAMGAHDRQWQRPELAAYETVMRGWSPQWLGGTAHYNPSVLRLLNEPKPDLAIVSDYSAPTAQLAMRALTLRGTPWLFWGEIPGFSQRGPVGTFMRNRLQAPLASAAAIAAIGSKAVSVYQELFPRKRIFNIPYFCDLAPYQQAKRRRSGIADGSINILFSGQLIERKGCDVLLTAFIRLSSSRPRARLILLGDGAQRIALERMVPGTLRDRVSFLGHREPHEIPEVFATAHIFCLPSLHDGWGVVVNEAIGAGLPIVVSDGVGAGSDLVRDGMNGYVTRTGDIHQLAAVLEQLVDDASLRARLSAASEAMAADWSLDEGASRWIMATDSVLEQACTA